MKAIHLFYYLPETYTLNFRFFEGKQFTMRVVCHEYAGTRCYTGSEFPYRQGSVPVMPGAMSRVAGVCARPDYSR